MSRLKSTIRKDKYKDDVWYTVNKDYKLITFAVLSLVCAAVTFCTGLYDIPPGSWFMYWCSIDALDATIRGHYECDGLTYTLAVIVLYLRNTMFFVWWIVPVIPFYAIWWIVHVLKSLPKETEDKT